MGKTNLVSISQVRLKHFSPLSLFHHQAAVNDGKNEASEAIVGGLVASHQSLPFLSNSQARQHLTEHCNPTHCGF